MVRTFIKAALAVACFLALSVFVPRANASGIDFACGAPATNACTGTITAGGGNAFSTTGIGMQSSFDGTEAFTAMFSTNSSGSGSISLSDTDGDSLSGQIVSTTTTGPFGGDQTVTFNVRWTSLSSSVQSALGSAQGIGQSTVIFTVSNGNVVSADLHVGPAPVPEPASLLLLGTGLLGMGAFIRRRLLA